jgi:anthranilate synthase component 1
MPIQSTIEKLSIVSESQELLADLDTPVSTFYKICKDKPHSFLLESVEGGEKLGRYSIIGTDPILIFKNANDKTTLENTEDKSINELEANPFSALKKILKSFTLIKPEFNHLVGFVGYIGYENIRWIEPKVDLKPFEKAPDIFLTLPGKLIVFDHILNKVNLIVNVFSNSKNHEEEIKEAKNKLKDFLNDFRKAKEVEPLSLNYKKNEQVNFDSNYTKEDFKKIVEEAKEHILSGDIFQVVLSQKMSVKGDFDGLLLYRILRSINPSPYLFYLNYGDFEIAGSSPEVMVKTEVENKERIASLRPIAGTYPRGKDSEEDLSNIKNLSNDPKEKAEHLMLVDLARNDLGRVCKPGSITVPELMVIEKYSHVLHMVSQVEGILKDDKTSIDFLCASFPAGTLSGAPKVRAMEIVNELENAQRGPYGGCIGFFGVNDTINTCMTIRTFVIYKDHLEIQAGAGIVADSIPENEYQETLRKGGALLRAISLLNN